MNYELLSNLSSSEAGCQYNIHLYIEALEDEEWEVEGQFCLLPDDQQPLRKKEIEAENEHYARMEYDEEYMAWNI